MVAGTGTAERVLEPHPLRGTRLPLETAFSGSVCLSSHPFLRAFICNLPPPYSSHSFATYLILLHIRTLHVKDGTHLGSGKD